MSAPVFQGWSLEPPARWKAGEVGAGANARPVYFDCARCGASEPEIAGFFGTGPRLSDIGVLRGGPPFKLAMYCAACWPVELERQRAASMVPA